MHSYKAQFSWMWLSVFTSYFQRTKLSTSRHKIPIVFKLLINISIAWNGFFFKISIIGEVIVYVDYCICNKIWNHRNDACWHMNIESITSTVKCILKCFSYWTFLTKWQRIYFPEKYSQIKDSLSLLLYWVGQKVLFGF